MVSIIFILIKEENLAMSGKLNNRAQFLLTITLTVVNYLYQPMTSIAMDCTSKKKGECSVLYLSVSIMENR